MSSFDFTFTPSRGPARAECLKHGREIVAITNRGSYTSPSGKTVDVAESVRSAVRSTIEYRADDALPSPPNDVRSTRTRVSVVNGTALASAQSFASREIVPLVLNFASAKNPGGGFLNGARAQEESLARCSALYACIEGREMYDHHRAMSDCMYTSWMIWSPDVPVFRDDETGELLETPYLAAFLTAPAPNAKVVLERDPGRRDEVETVLRSRVARSLAVARAHGHRHLVLGAWGCGVFGNDPTIVADAYRYELDNGFAGAFDEIVFAVLDWREDRSTIRPFVEQFVR